MYTVQALSPPSVVSFTPFRLRSWKMFPAMLAVPAGVGRIRKFFPVAICPGATVTFRGPLLNGEVCVQPEGMTSRTVYVPPPRPVRVYWPDELVTADFSPASRRPLLLAST